MRGVGHAVARMLSLSVFLVQFVIIGGAEQLTSVFFKSSYLRGGVQPLIENSHHLRVIFAYLKLWCDNSGLRPARFWLDSQTKDADEITLLSTHTLQAKPPQIRLGVFAYYIVGF